MKQEGTDRSARRRHREDAARRHAPRGRAARSADSQDAAAAASRRRRRNFLIALAVFAVAFAASCVVCANDARTESLARRRSASWQETTQGSHVISTIENYAHIAEVWQNVIAESGGQVEDFDAVSQRLFEKYGAYLQSIVIAPAGTVEYVYPLAGNEGMVGASLSSINHDGSYERAVATGAATVSSVSNSTQGRQAFSVFQPVYLENADGGTTYWGMVEVVVLFPDVFNGIGFSALSRQGYEYRLTHVVDGHEQTVIQSDTARLDDPASYTFEVLDENWTISLEPVDGWVDLDRAALLGVLLTLVSMALGFLTYFVLGLRERQQGYQQLSYIDALTGLANVRGYEEALRELQDSEIPYAIFAVDVNDFKHVNDTYGHDAGNVVLEHLGSRLGSCVRAGDIAYRVGGDEFSVVARGMSDLDVCARMADRIRTEAGQTDLVNGQPLQTSVSVGYARYPEDGATCEEVTRKADAAMYREKKLFHAQAGHSSRGEGADGIRAYREATDGLTGLPSIDYYRTFCAEAAKDVRERVGEPAVAFLDVEDFKLFNLRGGYDAGDRILMGIADLLRREFGGLLCARFDADHFVVLAPASTMREKLDAIHRDARRLGDSAPCEVKAGIYVPKDEGDVRVAHDRAKLACDSLKGCYDRWIAVYDDEFDHAEQVRHHVASEIGKALRAGWIEVRYQPIVRALTGQACGVEALSRWHDPEFGEIAPDVFVGELERARRVNVLDAWVVRQACRDLAASIRQGGPAVPVSVNISRADFELMDVRAMLQKNLSVYHLDRSMLVIEVTESAEVGSELEVRKGIQRLHEAGFTVWVDDYGAGHSTANLLVSMHYGALKIDRGFVRDAPSNQSARDMIGSVCDLAKRLSMQTVMEGVETADQLALARTMGADMVQGYLYSRPRTLKELENLAHSGELVPEDPRFRDYYEAIGRVNLRGQDPFDIVSGGAGARRQAVHGAGIVELAGSGTRMVAGDASFASVLGQLGVGVRRDPHEKVPPEEADEVPRGLASVTDPLVRRALETGEIERADFFSNGAYGTCRVRHVASCGGRHAFLVSIDIISSVDSFTSVLKSQDLLQHLYRVFDRIDLFDPARNTHRNVFAARPYVLKTRTGNMRDALDYYAASDVHPDDSARWLEFFDFATAEKRINDAGGCESEYFRTRNPDGSYTWQAYYLTVIRQDDGVVYLTCARNANLAEAARALAINAASAGPGASRAL